MSQEKNKPVLDEQTLAKLLEAAYVLQEHNREMQELELCLELKRDQVEAEEGAAAPTTSASTPDASATSAPADYTLTLARIVETQHHIQVRHLDLASALLLVAERVVEIAHASGAAVGILDEKNLVYRAVAGMKTPDVGVAVAVDKALCLPCIKTSQVLRCPDVNAEFLLDPEQCKRRGIQSLIAVPIFHEGGVAGALELYYPATQAFSEQDVHTCQLMAGLVTEALVRDEEITWKKSLASERAAMLEALEKLQPNLAALVGQSPNNGHNPAENNASLAVPLPPPVHDYACPKCGNKLIGEELFCGQCGSPRDTDYEPPSLQSKLAVMWEMHEAQKKEAPPDSASEELLTKDLDRGRPQSQPGSLAHVIEEQIPKLFRESEMPDEKTDHPNHTRSLELQEENEHELAVDLPENEEEEETSHTALAPESAKPVDWSSAASAREFLEQLVSKKRSSALVEFWNTRRGDIYLGIAIVLVLCVIRWGIFANHSANPQAASTAAAHHKSPEADLSLFDRMLIGLGLAEPPAVPEDKGNPSVQVWEDQKTGLYYCAGADLYGKGPKGKFTTQRDAQLDQFEPAYRKPCN